MAPLMTSSVRARPQHGSHNVIAVVVASVLFLTVHMWFISDRLGAQEARMEAGKTMIDEATAREIAKKDAMQVYRDLSIYKVKAELKNGKWYIDYDLEGEAMAGGGPHYVISGSTGEIVERRYEQ
jgi:hypothetical protein